MLFLVNDAGVPSVGQFLRLRKFEYVEASRALGQRTRNILFKQIFPNALTPVVTFSPFRIAGGVGASGRG